MAFDNLFIRTKRTIGGIELDNVLLEDHNKNVAITTNPIESGADITDHAIVLPDSLFIRGVVTDSPLGLAALGQIIDNITSLFGSSTSSNQTRSQQAFEAMQTLMINLEPITVVTKLKTYTNMLITNFNVSQDKDSSNIVFMDLTLEEIIITESVTVDLTEADADDSVKKAVTGTADRGKQLVTEPTTQESTSVLKTITDWIF